MYKTQTLPKPKLIVVFIIILMPCYSAYGIGIMDSLADADTSISDTPEKTKYPLFGLNIIKIAPSIKDFSIKGVVISYETSVGNSWLSVLVSARYYNGSKSTNSIEPDIPKHFRYEIQPRFWPITYMKGIFMGPLVNIYSTNSDIGVGALLGYQEIISGTISLEGFIAFQTRTQTEFYDSAVFLRLGVNLGIVFPKFE